MNRPLQGLRIARVSTIAFSTLTQLCPQLEAIHRAGGQVTVVSSPDPLSQELQKLPYCEFEPLYIARKINFFADLISLFRLWRFFRKQRFDIVHSITPKAGFLCAIAAKMAGVPIRLHTYTGQPWVTMSGLKRRIVRSCDKLISRLNTQCYTDSFTQRDFLIENKIIALDKIKVLGSGSLAGIDLRRFSPTHYSADAKQAIKRALNIKPGTRVLLFVGRITEDKGIDELFKAFNNVLAVHRDTILLVVGPFETDIEPNIRTKARQLGGNQIIFTGFCQQPEHYMSIADILCIPSYREGFGTVVIEAGAMGVPAIGTRIYGLTDAIVDGVTGLLVEPKNVLQLNHALNQLLDDEVLRHDLGHNAQLRAVQEFDSDRCGQLLVLDYIRLLGFESRQAVDHKRAPLQNQSRIVITGATGFVGQHLVRRLIDAGHYALSVAVRAIDPAMFPAQIEQINIKNISTNTDWTNALQGCEVLIHLAARVHVMQENTLNPLAQYRQMNVDSTINLARQAAQLGVKRFIFISSIKVNGESTHESAVYRADSPPTPQDAYAISKLEAEQALFALGKTTGMEIVIIRPTMIYGPGVKGNFQRMLAWLQKGYPLPLKSIKNKRSFVSVYNLVDLIDRCIDHPQAKNQIFLVSDGEDLSVGELLFKTAKAMNQSARLIPVPHWMLTCIGRLTGQQIIVQRVCGSLQVDISKTCELLDWKPVISPDEALRRTVSPV